MKKRFKERNSGKKIYKNIKNEYQLLEDTDLIEGEISILNGKFGFLEVAGQEDIFIPSPYLYGAMDGDIVLVEIIRDNDGKGDRKREGAVRKIVKKTKDILVGIFQNNKNFGFVSSKASRDIYVPKKFMRGAKTGDLVGVKVYVWGDETKKPEGEIIKILGRPNDTEALIEGLILNQNIKEKFSKEIYEELDKIKENIELKNRIDLRELNIITIDGESAKDLDDAVYVEKSNAGYRLLVNIADVSHYVKKGSELDKEALKRGNSIYLLDRVIPMLPKKLSNNLCSLNPMENKLTFTVEINFDNNGRIISNDFYKSVIKSKYRMTYENVNKIFDGDKDVRDKYREIVPMLENMLELSHKIRYDKKRRGSIDFELPEINLELDEKGKVKEIKLRERGESEKLIEDFMIVANESVAEKLYWEEIPAIYRVHENPEQEKIQQLNNSLIKLGYSIKNLDEIHPSKFQRIIEKTTGLPEGYLVHKLILKSMQRARYAKENLGHFGLASQYYLHFTSPIRRYADLIVHRVLSRSIEKYMNRKQRDKMGHSFGEISKIISKTERVADKLEEDSVKIKLIEYMQDKIGEEYTARLSGMNKNKIFLELENHIEVVYNINLNDDNFKYDEENYKIVNMKTMENFTMGSMLEVVVVSASYEKMEIEVVPKGEKVKKIKKRGGKCQY